MLTIRTSRLLLCPLVPEDAAPLAAYRSDPDVARYQSWTTPYPIEAARELIEQMRGRTRPEYPRPGEWNQLAIRLASDGSSAAPLIGDCAFRLHAEDARQASIGFTLARAHHGKGYATEGVRALLGELFGAFDLHRVTAECDAENVASRRLLERVGMRCEAHHVERTFFKGAWASEFVYAILRREWAVDGGEAGGASA